MACVAHHDDGDGGKLRTDAFEELPAIDGGHLDVHEDEVWEFGTEVAQRFVRCAGTADVVPICTKERREDIADDGFVVHDDDGARCDGGCVCGWRVG